MPDIFTIVEWPAKVLETKSPEVTVFDDELRNFVEKMHATMKSSNGIGLAANQVGSLQRVITIEIPYKDNRYDDDEGDDKQEEWHNKRWTFINPVITKKQGKTTCQEGCLSFPDIFEFVDRADEVWVSAVDEHGKPFEVHATGLFSICLQHEIDHIDGIVFINRMSRLKAAMVRKKVKRRQLDEVEVEA